MTISNATIFGQSQPECDITYSDLLASLLCIVLSSPAATALLDSLYVTLSDVLHILYRMHSCVICHLNTVCCQSEKVTISQTLVPFVTRAGWQVKQGEEKWFTSNNHKVEQNSHIFICGCHVSLTLIDLGVWPVSPGKSATWWVSYWHFWQVSPTLI